MDGSKSYISTRTVEYTFGDKGSVSQDGGKRLAGSDRFDTNNKINNEIGKSDVVTFVNGVNYPDALSAINMTTAKNSAIVLMGRNGNSGAKNFVAKSSSGFIVGGEVSTNTVNLLIKGQSGNSNINNDQKPKLPVDEKKPTLKPEPKPDKNTVKLQIINAITQDRISDIQVNKNSDFTKAQIPSGYKVLPIQRIEKNAYVFRLYVVPNSYTVASNFEEFEKIMAKAVINQMEEKKNIVLSFTTQESDAHNVSRSADWAVKSDKVNGFLWSMAFASELSPLGDFVEDNEVYIKAGDIKYKITTSYFTKEEFNREKYIQYLNRGVEILKSIGVYENPSMTDMEKARKICEWIWANSVYSPIKAIDGDSIDAHRRNRSPYSILEYGEGVCEGYSYTTSFLFNIAGIRVNTNQTSSHKWNKFKADGKWYMLDATDYRAGNDLTWERAFGHVLFNYNLGEIILSSSDEFMDEVYNFMESQGYTHLK